MRALTPLEARVLGVLVEKQHTVPDTYPLSLNALLAGCNQKTARDPVINATDAELLTAVDGLKSLSLVFEGSGSRVVKFEHNLPRVLNVPAASAALLTVLMLRGPQTAAELRLHCERLHRFADISSVEGFLDELAAKEPARVLKLPRAAGAREARWAHLLCGPVDASALQHAGTEGSTPHSPLQARIEALESEVDSLRHTVQRLCAALGLATDAAPMSPPGQE